MTGPGQAMDGRGGGPEPVTSPLRRASQRGWEVIYAAAVA
jgi:hypothetical protein